MITPIPFVPTPRLEYTQAYNRTQDNYEYYLLSQQREKAEKEDKRLEEFQKENDRKEKAMLDRLLEDNRRYMALANADADIRGGPAEPGVEVVQRVHHRAVGVVLALRGGRRHRHLLRAWGAAGDQPEQLPAVLAGDVDGGLGHPARRHHHHRHRRGGARDPRGAAAGEAGLQRGRRCRRARRAGFIRPGQGPAAHWSLRTPDTGHPGPCRGVA